MKGHASSRCRACRAVIFWATTADGQRLTLDATPREDGSGNIGIDENGVAYVASEEERARLRVHYVEHSAVCPNAPQQGQR